MLVSIITSVYNCEKYVNEMIDSIINQSFQDWELIIIDDASTDTTWDLISKYTDPRIIMIKNEKNVGLTQNLNKAITYAKGKYIVRMDGDDVAYTYRLERQIQFMETHPDIFLSGCAMKIFGKKNDVWLNTNDSEMLKVNLLFNAVVYHPTFILRKDILDKYELKYNENLLYAQDYDLEFQISKYGKIANISDILVKYRMHDGQVSTEKRAQQQECANVTRKNILSELNIFLNETSFNYWQRFCQMDYHTMSNEEAKELESVCKQIISNNKIKKIYNSEQLEKTIELRMDTYIQQCKVALGSVANNKEVPDKYYGLFMMMCQWLKMRQEGKSISSFFNRSDIKEIAIYGMSHVGKLLVEELRDSGITVKYGIDKDVNIQYFTKEIKIFRPTDFLENVEAVVVTPITYYEEIKECLSKKIECPILSLQDIIYELY